MEISPSALLALVAIVTALAFFFAYEHGKRFRRFSWEEYATLAIASLVAIVPIFVIYGEPVLVLFFVSIALGLFMEHVIGYLLHKSLKRHVWRYYRLTIGGYTSLLIAPFWGMAGLFFFLLSKTIGL